MRDRKVATRYAGALLASAQAEGVLVDVAESYAAVVEAAKGHPELRVFIDSPQVADQEKKDLIKSVFGDKIEPVLLHFIYLLIDKNRIDHFRDIGETFAEMVEEVQGVARAEVITAVSLPDDLAEALKAKLAGFTGKSIILEKKVNPAVIGGVCVTLGDKILDGTVRTNLDLLRKTLEKTQVR